MSRFATPQAQMQAVKAEARKSLWDAQRAIGSFPKDRLLCRIFSEENPAFILKGGQGMLARTDAARETRDIDILGMSTDLNESLAELKRLANIDLDDFLSFEFVSADPIKESDEYREGLSVRFNVFCGGQRLSPLSIDLVSDPAFRGRPQKMTPKTRLLVGDLPVFDYLVYPIEHVIADKVCATFETHGGRPSSRIKDLIDLGIVALVEPVDGSKASAQLAFEFMLRKIAMPQCFAIPHDWMSSPSFTSSYKKLAKQTRYSAQLADMAVCQKIVASLVNPLLDQSAQGKRWDPALQQWCD